MVQTKQHEEGEQGRVTRLSRALRPCLPALTFAVHSIHFVCVVQYSSWTCCPTPLSPCEARDLCSRSIRCPHSCLGAALHPPPAHDKNTRSFSATYQSSHQALTTATLQPSTGGRTRSQLPSRRLHEISLLHSNHIPLMRAARESFLSLCAPRSHQALLTLPLTFPQPHSSLGQQLVTSRMNRRAKSSCAA